MSLEAQIQNLESLDINLDEIENEKYAEAFRLLFTIIELQNEKIGNLNSENPKLRDENNLLKGEQIKPRINGSKKNNDISSENERKEQNSPKKRKANSRKHKIEIHKTEVRKVDRSILPQYAISKGYPLCICRNLK
jgi:hypothetical protein